MPSYITVRINGVTNGTDCDQCEQINRDYSLVLDKSHPWYCEWICDIGPGMEFYIWARIAYDHLTDDYSINVWLYMRHDNCDNHKDNNLYWQHRQPTPYDCGNLNVLVPLDQDESPRGCTGGSCRVLS